MTAQTKPNPATVPMLTLTLPIIFETLFRILVQSIDTIMLSSYSQEAVAGSGLVGQYIFFINLLFSMICAGTSIVLSQYLGARRHHDALQVVQASTVMVTITAAVLTLAVIFGAGPLLSLYSLDPLVRDYAWQYLVIYGGAGAFFVAFTQVQATILRSHGHTRMPMVVAMIANVLNVLGNSLALYGWFGLPVTGVVGVAFSSVLSQVVACLILALYIRSRKEMGINFKGVVVLPPRVYQTILKIGVPTAGEAMSYNVASIVIMAFISTLGTAAMSAQVYTMTIVRFVFATGAAIGSAVQIKTGYFVGARQPELAYRRLYKYQAAGTAISVVLIVLVNVFKTPIIALFTHDPAIGELTYTLLLYSIYIEFGRSINLITISALKGAGDVRFPVFYGMCSMWGIMVLGSWILGIQAGLGMVGIWLAIGTDETSRGLVMLARWKSKRWISKAIA